MIPFLEIQAAYHTGGYIMDRVVLELIAFRAVAVVTNERGQGKDRIAMYNRGVIFLITSGRSFS
jgi:hypothetical protein